MPRPVQISAKHDAQDRATLQRICNRVAADGRRAGRTRQMLLWHLNEALKLMAPE